MSYFFFENTTNDISHYTPNDFYREQQQAFIDYEWDNTTAIKVVKEQEEIGSSIYNDIEVNITPTVDDTVTGMKSSGDFLKFIFKSIDHKTKRGLYYKFDDNYWIVHNYNEFNGVVQDCGVRRCNNSLRIIDPLNGSLFSIPCVIEYDMAASTAQVSRYVITPNNHAVIMVQGNEQTLRLFKTNTRFMLSGRPFKLYGYQNAVEFDLDNQITTLLYLDLYLDEIRDGDNIDTGLADNGRYNYTIKINSDNLVLPEQATGKLTANVSLNGVETDREIVWASSNKDIVSIDTDGNYIIKGKEGQVANVSATLDGNVSAYDNISVTVGNEVEADYKIVVVPNFEIIRQYQKIPFEIKLYKDSDLVEDEYSSTIATNSSYVTITNIGNNKYTMYCSKIAKEEQSCIINVSYDENNVSLSETFKVKTVSMMG